MDRFRLRLAIRRDEIAGFGAGAAFAGSLAAVSGAAIVIVFALWLRAAGRSGTGFDDDSDLLIAMWWWGVLWLVLSAGLLLALWLSFRAWDVLYPLQREHEASRERRAAVASVAALLAEHRSVPASDEE